MKYQTAEEIICLAQLIHALDDVYGQCIWFTTEGLKVGNPRNGSPFNEPASIRYDIPIAIIGETTDWGLALEAVTKELKLQSRSLNFFSKQIMEM